MNCKKCGAKIEKGTAFCGKCGAKIESHIEENHNRVAAQTESPELTNFVSNGKSKVNYFSDWSKVYKIKTK